MIPLRDDNPTQKPAVVTITLIGLNVAIGIWSFLLAPVAYEAFVYKFGAIPLLISRDYFLLPQLPGHWPTLISSMFLHGGIMHLAGNMLYLWIFGNNIEDRLGHFKFLLFYLLGGIVAALSHYIGDPVSKIPMIGASGAISAVLGAYVVLFPRARIATMLWFFFIVRIIHVPAFIVLGLWFVMQLTNVLGANADGVAWWAHIGGFLAGTILIFLFGGTRKLGRVRAHPY